MLVLSRKNEESILIGDNIRIVIDQCHNGKCRVMIDAPRHIHIVRGEIAHLCGQIAASSPDQPELGGTAE